MKNCKKIHALLPLYAEKQLSAPDQAAVESHLRDCAEARAELKQLKRLGQTLKDLPEPKLPPGLHDKIMNRVHGKAVPADNRFWLKTATGLAAAAGLVFLFFAQNFGWLNHSQVALKPTSPASLNSAPVAPSADRDLSAESAASQTNQPVARLELNKPLDSRLSMKSTGGVEYALKSSAPAAPAPMAQTQITSATPPMVLAFGNTVQPQKKAMAFNNKNLSYDASTATNGALAAPSADYAAGANDNGQAETKIGLNYQASLPDVIKTQTDDKQTPQILRLDTIQIGLNKYQLNWQTDLVTKGQLFVMDSTGNTLQALSETGQPAYDHQRVIDNTPANTNFYIKLLVTYLNGNQAVTFTQPLNPTPAL